MYISKIISSRCFGSTVLSINSWCCGNGLAMGSRYSTSLLPCQTELSELFVTVVSHICVSIPTLVSKSIIIGSSSIIMGFISFLIFPIDFAPLCVSDGLAFFALL